MGAGVKRSVVLSAQLRPPPRLLATAVIGAAAAVAASFPPLPRLRRRVMLSGKR